MVMSRFHSRLPIRLNEIPSVGTLCLPKGLDLTIPEADIDLRILPGDYTFSKNITGFYKERGVMCINKVVFYVEIIYIIYTKMIYPVIIRLWNVNDLTSFEFLMSDTVVSARCVMLHTRIPTTTINNEIGNFVSSFDSELDNLHNITTSDLIALGWIGDIDVFLIPNYMVSEYQMMCEAMRINSISNMVKILFNGISSFNISILMHELNHMFNKNMVDSFKPIKTTNRHYNDLRFNIYHMRQYSALLSLLRIPYDTFVIKINLPLTIDSLVIENINSISGPFTLKYNTDMRLFIYRLIDDFVNNYFVRTHNYRFIDIMNDDPSELVVDSILLWRTNDEYLDIDIYSNGEIYSRTIDLILLSLMSPSIEG